MGKPVKDRKQLKKEKKTNKTHISTQNDDNSRDMSVDENSKDSDEEGYHQDLFVLINSL